jgi:hypothetical protein
MNEPATLTLDEPSDAERDSGSRNPRSRVAAPKPFRVLVEIGGGVANTPLDEFDDLVEACGFAATCAANGPLVYFDLTNTHGEKRSYPETIIADSIETGYMVRQLVLAVEPSTARTKAGKSVELNKADVILIRSALSGYSAALGDNMLPGWPGMKQQIDAVLERLRAAQAQEDSITLTEMTEHCILRVERVVEDGANELRFGATCSSPSEACEALWQWINGVIVI